MPSLSLSFFIPVYLAANVFHNKDSVENTLICPALLHAVNPTSLLDISYCSVALNDLQPAFHLLSDNPKICAAKIFPISCEVILYVDLISFHILSKLFETEVRD